MNRSQAVVMAMCVLGLLAGSTVDAAALLYDQQVTFGDVSTGPADPVHMLYGSNINAGFTVDRRNGIELGLRAQLRFDANNISQNVFNSNGDGTYTFAPGTPDLSKPHPDWAGATTPVWSLAFTVNTDYEDRDGTPNAVISDYTYEVGVDFDPVGTSKWLRVDPISENGLLGTLGVPDHAFGLYTQQTPGIIATNATDYLTALNTCNIAQNITNYEFFNMDLTTYGLGDFSGFDPNQEGSYTIYLAAFSGGTEVARTEIMVIVGNPLLAPNVIGDTEAAATTAITGAGLTVGTVTHEYSATVPAGGISSQIPPAGTVVTPGTPVDLVVSWGPEPVVIPEPVTFGDISTGPSDPVQMLFGVGVGNGGFTVDRRNGVELGLRASLRFDANNQAQNIFNASGDGTYTFAPGTPDLSKPHPDWATTTTPVWNIIFAVNTDYEDRDGTPDAVLADYTYEVGIDFDPVGTGNWLRFDPISANGLFNTLGVPDHAFGLYTQQHPGITPGTVADYATALSTYNIVQNGANAEFFNMDLSSYGMGDYSGFDPNQPGAYTVYLAAYSGATEVARTEITVVVGTPLLAPDVIGQTQAAAATAITGAGLTVGAITHQYSATVPAGSVVSQNPAAGTVVTPGSPVALVVSSGPEPVLEPELVTFGDIGTGPSDPVQMLYGAGTNGAFTVDRRNGVEIGLRAQLRFDANNRPQDIYNHDGNGSYHFAPGTPDLSKPHPDWATTTTPIWSVAFSINTDYEDRDGTPANVLADYTYEVGVDFDPVGTGNWLRFDPISTNGLFNTLGVPDHAFGLYPQQSPGIQPTTLPDYAAVLGATNIVQNIANYEFFNLDLSDYGMGDYSGFDPNVPGIYTVYLAAFSGATEVARTQIQVVVGSPILVPDLAGMTQADAEAALLAANLVLGTVSQAYSSTVPTGAVVAQDPVAGASVSSGAAVAVVISMGPAPVAVPNVVGQTLAAATASITGATLAVGNVTQQYNLTVPAGSVISQSPSAGTQLLPGAPVDLVVSLGGISVPNVVGQTQAAATTSLTGVSLAVGGVTQEYSITVPSGSVISQTPTAGTQVLPGATVDLVVSRGGITVPNVVGLTQAAATASITGMTLTVGTVTQEYSLTVPAGSVISQTPVAGTMVLPGATVNLAVSLGGIPVPNVIGQTQAGAITAITNASLVVLNITQAHSLTVPAGSVISQTPVAGTMVLPGTPVHLLVSQGGITVPNVTGQAQASAANAITGAGLAVGTVTQEYSLTVPAGSVISQNPAPGTQALPGWTVDMVVSLGAITVPDVVGMAQTPAATSITAAGLVVGTVTEQYSLTVPAGSVISQSPFGGVLALPGATVDLVVSLGGVTVPDVVGQTQTAASTAIIGAGLTVGTVSQQYSTTVPAGSVISQSPSGGAAVLPGSAVDLVVSLGSQLSPVPDLTGQTLAAATAAITDAGFAVGSVTQQYSTTVSAGNIVSQTPPAGTQTLPGTVIDLVVSLGPQPVAVPNVVGLTQAAATLAITGASLEIGTVTLQYSPTVPVGSVISQAPSSGEIVPAGSAVDLVVSRGVAPVSVPNVVGMEASAARSAIIGAGFAVGSVTEVFDDNVPLGLVISQNPTGGILAVPGTPVDIVVSRGPGVVMPDVLGMTGESATLAIEAVGLVVGTIVEDFSDTVPANHVLSQSPAGGEETGVGVTVSFVVSLGPKAVVPDLAGMPLDEAQDTLLAAGLTISVVEEPNDTVSAGDVIRQAPGANAAVTMGSTVTVYVSSGPDNWFSCLGCKGAMTGKSGSPFDGLNKRLGDLFLAGLGLVVLSVMARRGI